MAPGHARSAATLTSFSGHLALAGVTLGNSAQRAPRQRRPALTPGPVTFD